MMLRLHRRGFLLLGALAGALALASGVAFATVSGSAKQQGAATSVSYDPITGKGATGYTRIFSGQAFVRSH
jgi:hypothetical protein